MKRAGRWLLGGWLVLTCWQSDPCHGAREAVQASRLEPLVADPVARAFGVLSPSAARSACSPYAQGSGFTVAPDGRAKVGDTVRLEVETPHPYPPGDPGMPVVWSHTVTHPGASFIKVHLRDLALAPGDYVTVRNGEGVVKDTISEAGDVWCGLVLGDTAIVELHAGGGAAAYGFRIAGYAYGFARASFRDQAAPPCEHVRATCGNATETAAADAVGAVFTVASEGGVFFCTGFLIAPSKFITNDHCVPDLYACKSTDVFFDYEDDCMTGAPLAEDGPFRCESTEQGTLSNNSELDYTVMVLEGTPDHATLSTANSPAPAVDDQLFLIGHPGGARKRLSHEADCKVVAIDVDACGSGTRADSYLRHGCDAQGGSSGSPILKTDGTLIGLNKGGPDCATLGGGGCGVPITLIAADEGTTCGNGVLEFPERCDDGNLISGDGCDANCSPTGCGNGILTAGEQCDDRNMVGGDCCSPSCQYEAPGSPCNDGSPCTRTDACSVGVCAGLPEPEPVCRTALTGSLLLRERGARDQLAWTWKKGEAIAPADLGDPVGGTTSYDLCVYDEQGGVARLFLHAAVPGGGTCRGRPCWRVTGSSSLRYTDPEATHGVRQLTLKPGPAGRASVQLKARGERLALPPLPLVQDGRVTVQLKSSGACFGTGLAVPASHNDAGQFRDRLP